MPITEREWRNLVRKAEQQLKEKEKSTESANDDNKNQWGDNLIKRTKKWIEDQDTNQQKK